MLFLNKYSLLILIFFAITDHTKGQDILTPTDDLRRESKFIDAQSRVIIGDTEEALKIYQNLLKEDPNDDEAAFFMGKIYLQKNDIQNSIKFFSLALAIEKANPWYYLWAADAYLQNDQFDQATSSIEMLIREFPDEKQYYERLEYLYRDSKQYQKQLDLLDEMISRFGFHKTYALGKIQALSDLDRETEALKLLEDLSENFSKDLFILNLLATFYQQADETEKAHKIFERILVVDPGNSRAHLALLHSQNKDSSAEENIRSLKPFFLNSKIDFDTKFSKIASYFKGDLKEIPEEEINMLLEVSEWLLKSHPDTPKALSLRADLFAQSGQNAEAAELYKRTVHIHPDNYLVWEQLLWSLKELERWEEIRKYGEEATLYFPNKASIYFIKGEAEYHLNDADEALFDLETGISLSSDDPVLQSSIYALMGTIYCPADEGNSEKHFTLAKEVLEENPDIDYYKSICDLEKNEITEAMSHINAALDKVPDQPGYVVQKAKILFRGEQYQEALDFLLPFSEKMNYYPLFSYISQIYDQLDQPDKAGSYKQKAIDYGAPK